MTLRVTLKLLNNMQKIEVLLDKADIDMLELLQDEISPIGAEGSALYNLITQIIAKTNGYPESRQVL